VALGEQVQDLVRDGTLSQSQARPLLAKVAAAQEALAVGDAEEAAGALGAFLHQVEAYVRTGRLSPVQGTALTTAAQAIRDSLDEAVGA
jgi:hypothetical protein